MTFNCLTKFADYWYLPRMDGLFVFKAETGERVVEWFVHDSTHEWNTWSFHEVLNLLPTPVRAEFRSLIREWQQTVDARLRQVFSEGE